MVVIEELTLGERVHLASKDLRKILNPSIAAALIGLAIIGLVTLSDYYATNTINEYGYHQYRLNSPDGPLCESNGFTPSNLSDPAKIVVTPGSGADKAGLQKDDVITEINGIKIATGSDLQHWYNLSHGVKPGDTVNVKVFRNTASLSFNVQTIASKSNSTLPVLGVIVPLSCEQYYFLNENEKSLTLDAIRNIDRNLGNIHAVVIVFAFIFAYFFVWTLWKGRKLKKDVDAWEEAYLNQYYVLTFETNTPRGSTNGEKIFNMAQTIFPELRKKNGKPEKWDGEVIGKDGYEYDCVQLTNESEPRVFIVKHFGTTKVDLEKLQQSCDNIIESISTKEWKKNILDNDSRKIFRVICVAQEYDEGFMKDSSRQTLMDDLEFEYPLDLIIEKEGNYTVLWVET